MNIRQAVFFFVLFLFFQLLWGRVNENEVLLFLQPITGDDFTGMNVEIRKGDDSLLSDQEDTFCVIGVFNDPSFTIPGFQQVIAYDAADQPLTLIIDRSSLYSEFENGEINSMRIAILIDQKTFQNGYLRLSWGEELKADNKLVDEIKVYRNHLDRYRTFNWESEPIQEESETYASSVDILVDDYSDTYFLWYLLPLVLLFILLIIRKKLLK